MSNLFVAGYDLYFDTLSMTNCLFFETCCIRCIPVLIRNKYGVLTQYYTITTAVTKSMFKSLAHDYNATMRLL